MVPWLLGSSADALAGPPPHVATILDDEGLRDEAAGEIGRRAADAEHLGSQTLVIGRGSHFGESREQLVAEHHVVVTSAARQD